MIDSTLRTSHESLSTDRLEAGHQNERSAADLCSSSATTPGAQRTDPGVPRVSEVHKFSSRPVKSSCTMMMTSKMHLGVCLSQVNVNENFNLLRSIGARSVV